MDKLEKVIVNNKEYRIDGDSAYETAIKNGFEGTEEDWLNSLIGKTPEKGVDYFTDEDVDEIVESVSNTTMAKIGYITLLASEWTGTESPYAQVVALEDVSENSQVDLTPSVEQLAVFHEKDLAFVTENDGGVVTVYAVGQKPINDYDIQVTITGVAEWDGKIIGVTVGTPLSPSKIDDALKPVKTVNGEAPDEDGNVIVKPSLTNEDKKEIVECIAQGLIPQEGVIDRPNSPPWFKMEGAKECMLVGEASDFEQGSLWAIVGDYTVALGSIGDLPKPQSNTATFKVLYAEDRSSYLFVHYEYCGVSYETKVGEGKLSEEALKIHGISVRYSGKVYLVDPTIKPKYEVTEEIKTEIANLVLNSMTKAEDLTYGR